MVHLCIGARNGKITNFWRKTEKLSPISTTILPDSKLFCFFWRCYGYVWPPQGATTIARLLGFLYLCELFADMEKKITVYCGSSDTLPAEYGEAAAWLGREIAAAGATLVTGAGRSGLMGAVENGAIEAGGRVVGVIPRFMHERGWHHTGLDELVITEDMHSRKELMAKSLACIALPGGIGTLEELCEIITWKQLGLFLGNVVILNIKDYYSPLLSMLGKAVREGFMRADHLNTFSVADNPRQAVELALASSADTDFSPKFV